MTSNKDRIAWLNRKLRNFRSGAVHYLSGIYHRADDHHIFLMAGGLSFSLFTCILPMILIIFAILGSVLNKPSISAEITAFIERIIPYEDIAQKIKDLVFNRVDEFVLFKNLAGVLGIGGLLFAASGLFSSMRTILNTIFKVDPGTSILISKLRDLGLVLIVVVYFLLSTTVLPGLDITHDLADQMGLLKKLNLDFLKDFLLSGVSLFIIFISFMLVYLAIPQQRLPKRTIFVSALTAAVLWHIAQQIFGFYITNVVTLKRVYGAYFFLIVVAFWIYYTSLVFIIGAEIGQLHRERHKGDKDTAS